MPGWADVVTTALLGTDRRPVPSPLPAPWGSSPNASGDPATVTLDLAVQHRIWLRAGSRLGTAEPPTVGPPLGDLAPVPAQQLLGRLLEAADRVLINAWLAACVRLRLGISPDHWPLIAVLTSETIPYDGALLAHALGPRGRWFVAQNRQWTRLARQLEEAVILPESSPASGDAQAQLLALAAALSAKDLEAIFAIADPWSAELVDGLLDLLTDGAMQVRGIRLAARIGSRMPATSYRRLAPVVERFLGAASPARPIDRLLVGERLAALERTAWARVEIDRAFAGATDASAMTAGGPDLGLPERLDIPRVA
jgi:hypothetical protein